MSYNFEKKNVSGVTVFNFTAPKSVCLDGCVADYLWTHKLADRYFPCGRDDSMYETLIWPYLYSDMMGGDPNPNPQ